MFVLKRNQIIITALIIMIAVAGYLNYQDSKSAKQTGLTLNENGEIEAMAPSSVNSGNDIGVALTYDGVVDDNPSISVDLMDASAAGDQTANQGIDNGQVSDSSEEEPGASIFVSGPADSSSFINAKFDREQARSKQKGLLMDMINNTNLDQDKKAEAADSLMQMQKRIEKESAAEAMIEAKGFGEAYVRIDDDSVDVLVSKSALTEAEIAQIEDIVKRKTGMNEEQIRISPMKK